MSIINISSAQATYTKDSVEKSLEGLSNTHELYLISDVIILTQTSNRTEVEPGDEITYTLTINNISPYSLDKITLKNQINENAIIKEGSVTIDGVFFPEYDITAGINISGLASQETMTITYKAKVISEYTCNHIVSQANMTAQIEIENEIKTFEVLSNIVVENIISAEMTISKTTNKQYVVTGEIVTYTIGITNTGSKQLENLMFKDTLTDTHLEYITGTVPVNGTLESNYDPTQGFPLNNLASGQTHTISFKVTII